MNAWQRRAFLMACLAVALLAGGCQTPVRLMPTPVGFTTAGVDPFGDPGKTARTEIPVPYATNRLPLIETPESLFTALAGADLRVGIAHVRIGDDDLEWEALHRLSTSDDVEQRPIVRLDWLEPKGLLAGGAGRGTPAEAQAFFELIERALALSPGRDLVVFVHGANTPVSRAAAQAAQFQHFATRRVVVLSFMWPSFGSILRYLTDVGSAAASVEPFARLLQTLAERTRAASIHVLAYSAGAKIVSPALALLGQSDGQSPEAVKARLRLGHIYFAAPDFDTRRFVDQMRDYIAVVERVTVSVNFGDSALRFAAVVHRASRAGRPDPSELDAGQLSFMAEASQRLGFDLVDVDPAVIPGLPPRSHAFWYEHPWVSSDVLALLLFDAAPERRGLVARTATGGTRVWGFPPDFDQRIARLFAPLGGAAAPSDGRIKAAP